MNEKDKLFFSHLIPRGILPDEKPAPATHGPAVLTWWENLTRRDRLVNFIYHCARVWGLSPETARDKLLKMVTEQEHQFRDMWRWKAAHRKDLMVRNQLRKWVPEDY